MCQLNPLNTNPFFSETKENPSIRQWAKARCCTLPHWEGRSRQRDLVLRNTAIRAVASTAWLTFLEKLKHRTMSSWELQWYTLENRRKAAQRKDHPTECTATYPRRLTASAVTGGTAAHAFLSRVHLQILPWWDENAGNTRGSAAALLLPIRKRYRHTLNG